MLTANAYPHNSVCGYVWSGGAMCACIPGVKGEKKLRVMDMMPIDLIVPKHSVVVTFVFILCGFFFCLAYAVSLVISLV